jgi:septal ring factor EnvC (AmiA/AmiB activator)
VPDSRRRLPAEVADLADSLWQRALGLAMDAAKGSDESIRTALAQLRSDAELRGHALAQREIEIDALVRSRERTIRELEEHLRATMSLVNKRDATINSLEARLAASLSETEGYRQRLAAMVARALGRHRSMPAAKAVPRRPTSSATRRRKVARSAPMRVAAAARARSKPGPSSGKMRSGKGR